MLSFATLRKLVLGATLGAALAVPSAASFGSVFVSVGIAPPALPVYAQPICPGQGYLWTPGYWAWSDTDQGYYWVPGVWVEPPTVGVLWTPGYWGWGGSAYLWHAGYWGPHVGFYGGINYGFGYTGIGYGGGYWNHGVFAYNRSVNNINVTNIHNVYNRTVVVNNYNRVSYNGGRGGLEVRPSGEQLQAQRERHFDATANQIQHRDLAGRDRAQFASVNNGHPPMAAQARVGDRGNAFASRGYAAAHPGSFAADGQQRGLAGNRDGARPANTVNGREANQQGRIGRGVQNGQLTNGEAARAERQQGRIDNQVRTERQANGGTLNRPERQQVQREQDRASRQIRNEDHNDRERRNPEPHDHNR